MHKEAFLVCILEAQSTNLVQGPTTPVFERAKTVHALDRAATVIGFSLHYRYKIIKAFRLYQYVSLVSMFLNVSPSWQVMGLETFLFA
jgi:hypothetical protein